MKWRNVALEQITLNKSRFYAATNILFPLIIKSISPDNKTAGEISNILSSLLPAGWLASLQKSIPIYPAINHIQGKIRKILIIFTHPLQPPLVLPI